MAFDKVVDSQLLDNGLMKISTSIKNKTGLTEKLTFPNGMSQAIDNIKTVLPNGTSWERSNIQFKDKKDGEVISVTYDNGIWLLILDNSKIYKSLDGKIWNQKNDRNNNIRFSKIVYGKGLWTTGNLYSEDNGETWAPCPEGAGNLTSSLDFGQNSFRCVGPNNQYYTSYDGKNWTATGFPSGDRVKSLFYKDGIWFFNTTGGMKYSFGGAGHGYTDIPSLPESNLFVNKGIWISYGKSGFWFSEDLGVNWKECSFISTPIEKVIFYNGIWIAIGKNNLKPSYGEDIRDYFSLDGKKWNWQSKENHFSNLIYDNQIWFRIKMESTGYPNYFSMYKLEYSLKNNPLKEKTWSLCQNIVNNKENPDMLFSFKTMKYANGIWVLGTDTGVYYSVAWESDNV